MCMLRYNGFILFMVLIYLLLGSILSITILSYAANELKQTNNQWLHMIYVDRAVRLFDYIEDGLLISFPYCTILPLARAHIMKQPMAWWKQYGCEVKNAPLPYYYIVENLGHDDCRVIENNGHYFATQQYRITLLVLPANMKGARIKLQSVGVKSTGQLASCSKVTQVVTSGRQYWYEI